MENDNLLDELRIDLVKSRLKKHGLTVWNRGRKTDPQFWIVKPVAYTLDQIEAALNQLDITASIRKIKEISPESWEAYENTTGDLPIKGTPHKYLD